MNIIEMLTGGGQAPEIAEIERLGENMWARQKWTKLTNLQRCRIEVGYIAAKAVENDLFVDAEATLAFWLKANDDGKFPFDGVVMEVQKDGEFSTIKVTDGREEFLIRGEPDGLNITGVAKLGEAKLQDDRDD